MQDNCSVYPYTSGADLEPSLDPALQMFIILINGGLGFSFFQTIFIMGAISYSELTYKRKTFEYDYPSWAIGVGWMLAMVSVIWIPIIFIKRVLDAEGSLAQVQWLLMDFCCTCVLTSIRFFSSVEYWTFVLLAFVQNDKIFNQFGIFL